MPDQGIDADSVIRSFIEFNSVQNILEGVLVYRIQKKYVESDRLIQDESESAQLLVAWRGEHAKELHLRSLLVEHDGEFNWDEDKLRWLHQKYWHLLNVQVEPDEGNWQLNDATMLKTKVKAMNGGYKWDIFISEGDRCGVGRPLWIDTTK
jgi:hypothetical protein